MAPTKVDPADPAVRRLVYNMYRGMLGGYNDQANTIVDALPPERVREDQGVYKQLEAIIRQTSGQGDADVGDGGCSAPPPPPPPPAPGGGIPSMRINSEIESRARSPRPSAPGEPPAAIQNAMMTKDKKPFTYTPGGLDLSQIRSPRIQRRINRNMADEGVAAPPPAAAAPTAPAAPGLYGQPPPPPPPQPAGQARFGAQPPPPPPPAYAPPLGGAQASVSAQAVLQGAANLRPTSIPPLRREQPAAPEPGGLYIAPLAAAAPAPAAPRAQLGSLYIPPVADTVDAVASPSPPPPPQRHFSPASPQATLNKAPMPWMSSQRPAAGPATPATPASPAAQPGSRIIPIQIEGRESPQGSAPHTPHTPQEGHLSQWQREQQLRQQQRQQQQMQHHQQVQQSPPVQPQAPWRTVHTPTSPPAQPGERVIPIQFESSNGTASPPAARQPPPFHPQHQQQYQPQQQQQYQPQQQQQHPYQQQPQFQPQQQQQFQRRPQQYNSGPAAAGPGEWSAGPPIQSNSFRVLQKITDDPPQQPGRMNEMNAAQLRRLQLNDEDRALMDRFKAQVDDEVYLHQEADPRYRGAAIPSRAFRMLQNMTGEDDGSSSMPLPSRISPAVRLAQQAVQDSAASQAYVPPSEQTAPEPRKYVGAAIPSRSFRMLQAMTGSENCDPADTSDL